LEAGYSRASTAAIASSSAWALAAVAPLRRRPISRKKWNRRTCISLERSGSGVQTSTPPGKSNPAGITPTIVAGWPSRTSVRPTTAGSLPNLLCQRPWLMAATSDRSSCSSAAANARPSIGATPSVSRSPADTDLTFMTSGSPLPDTSVGWLKDVMAARPSDFACAR
jgi:hypothetical protein